jgi:hypothetical protein
MIVNYELCDWAIAKLLERTKYGTGQTRVLQDLLQLVVASRAAFVRQQRIVGGRSGGVTADRGEESASCC